MCKREDVSERELRGEEGREREKNRLWRRQES
jgi:hypothetical protein